MSPKNCPPSAVTENSKLFFFSVSSEDRPKRVSKFPSWKYQNEKGYKIDGTRLKNHGDPLRDPLKVHPRESGVFTCNKCSKQFLNKDHGQQHQKSCTGITFFNEIPDEEDELDFLDHLGKE